MNPAKILQENSILNRLPAELPKKEFIIFDAFRFSLEIIEYSFTTLEEKLLHLSENGKNEVSITFHYAWSIIDYSNRIKDLLMQLPWENQEEILGSLYPLREFRNTFQHLGGRKEVLNKRKTPMYGILTWIYKNLSTQEFKPFTIISGIIQNPELGWKIPEISKSTDTINSIELQTVDGNKVIKADLKQIMVDLKTLTLDIENRLLDYCERRNLKSLNWDKRKDILIKINHGTQK